MTDPSASPDPGGEAIAPPPKTRVLIPSALGVLGIELTGDVLTRVVIVPIGKERKLYKPLGELKKGERSDQLDEVLGRFSELLAGARRRLDLQYDLRATPMDAFARRVLKETGKIPYGRTKTYQQLATSAGRPGAYRQVLSALTVNPLPLVIPCHRVITSKSGIGSYIGGSKRKAWLLKLESRNLPLL